MANVRGATIRGFGLVKRFSNGGEHSRNLRSALTWRRSGVQVSSGPLRETVGLEEKLKEVYDASACIRGVIRQQPTSGLPTSTVLWAGGICCLHGGPGS